MPRHRQPPELPPAVAAHVRAQLLAYDWDTKVKELLHLCEGCPAERAEETCAYCPLEGVALSAAHVAMQAKIEKLRAKSQTTKKVKRQLSQIAEKMETDK
jgi:DNA-binding NtrC family response regulator